MIKKALMLLLVIFILEGCSEDLSPPEKVETPTVNPAPSEYHSPNSEEPDDEVTNDIIMQTSVDLMMYSAVQ